MFMQVPFYLGSLLLFSIVHTASDVAAAVNNNNAFTDENLEKFGIEGSLIDFGRYGKVDEESFIAINRINDFTEKLDAITKYTLVPILTNDVFTNVFAPYIRFQEDILERAKYGSDDWPKECIDPKNISFVTQNISKLQVATVTWFLSRENQRKWNFATKFAKGVAELNQFKNTNAEMLIRLFITLQSIDKIEKLWKLVMSNDDSSIWKKAIFNKDGTFKDLDFFISLSTYQPRELLLKLKRHTEHNYPMFNDPKSFNTFEGFKIFVLVNLVHYTTERSLYELPELCSIYLKMELPEPVEFTLYQKICKALHPNISHHNPLLPFPPSTFSPEKAIEKIKEVHEKIPRFVNRASTEQINTEFATFNDPSILNSISHQFIPISTYHRGESFTFHPNRQACILRSKDHTPIKLALYDDKMIAESMDDSVKLFLNNNNNDEKEHIELGKEYHIKDGMFITIGDQQIRRYNSLYRDPTYTVRGERRAHMRAENCSHNHIILIESVKKDDDDNEILDKADGCFTRITRKCFDRCTKVRQKLKGFYSKKTQQ